MEDLAKIFGGKRNREIFENYGRIPAVISGSYRRGLNWNMEPSIMPTEQALISLQALRELAITLE